MKNLTKKQIWLTSICICLLIGFMAADEAAERQREYERAGEISRIARQEAAAKRIELNRLAKRGEYYTGMEARQQ